MKKRDKDEINAGADALLYPAGGGIAVWVRRGELEPRAAIRFRTDRPGGESIDIVQLATICATLQVGLDRVMHALADKAHVDRDTFAQMTRVAYDTVKDRITIPCALDRNGFYAWRADECITLEDLTHWAGAVALAGLDLDLVSYPILSRGTIRHGTPGGPQPSDQDGRQVRARQRPDDAPADRGAAIGVGEGRHEPHGDLPAGGGSVPGARRDPRGHPGTADGDRGAA